MKLRCSCGYEEAVVNYTYLSTKGKWIEGVCSFFARRKEEWQHWFINSGGTNSKCPGTVTKESPDAT
jgi:hypothetical protein